jgi:hypothetical protein
METGCEEVSANRKEIKEEPSRQQLFFIRTQMNSQQRHRSEMQQRGLASSAVSIGSVHVLLEIVSRGTCCEKKKRAASLMMREEAALVMSRFCKGPPTTSEMIGSS